MPWPQSSGQQCVRQEENGERHARYLLERQAPARHGVVACGMFYVVQVGWSERLGAIIAVILMSCASLPPATVGVVDAPKCFQDIQAVQPMFCGVQLTVLLSFSPRPFWLKPKTASVGGGCQDWGGVLSAVVALRRWRVSSRTKSRSWRLVVAGQDCGCYAFIAGRRVGLRVRLRSGGDGTLWLLVMAQGFPLRTVLTGRVYDRGLVASGPALGGM